MSHVILLTRSKEDNFRFIKLLQEERMAAETVNLPFVEYGFKPFDPSLKIEDAGKIIVTSRRAAQWVLQHRSHFVNRIFLVVGEATSEVLQKYDMEVEKSFPNVGELQAYLESQPPSPFFYIRGKQIKADLCLILNEKGHSCREVVVYEVYYLQEIKPLIRRKILTSELIILPLFSTASAKYILGHLFSGELDEARTRTKLLCISDAVLKSVADEGWAGTYVSEQPTLSSMCDLIKEISNE